MKRHLNRKKLVGGLLLAILFCFSVRGILALAGGDANANTDGNDDLGKAQSGWYWDGTYGARISIVDKNGKTLEGPMDFFPTKENPGAWFRSPNAIADWPITNKSMTKVTGTVDFKKIGSFGALRYQSYVLADLPRLVTSSREKTNLDTIINYFTDDGNTERILQLMSENGAPGTHYTLDQLIDTKNSLYLMIEPLAITEVTIDGDVYDTVMSATDIAVYDKKMGGTIRPHMRSLSHKNLPFGLFLKKTDCGMNLWTGATNTWLQSTDNTTIMKDGLGVGLVKYQSFSYEAYATLYRFIDKNEDGIYRAEDGDIVLPEFSGWPKYYAKGLSTGTLVSPSMIRDRAKELKWPLYDNSEMGSVSYEGKTYIFNSAYGSYYENGKEVDSSCTYFGKNPANAQDGWNITHTITDSKNYHFHLGYIDPNAKRTLTIHYMFDGVEDEALRKVESNLTRNSTFNLAANYPTADYCKEQLTHVEASGTYTYNLTDVYTMQGDKEVHTPTNGTHQMFWGSRKFTMTSNVDVYVCYTKPLIFKATLKFVDEEGKELTGTLANDLKAQTTKATITEGKVVQGSELFKTLLSGTGYKALKADGITYNISKFSYQHAGGAEVKKSADKKIKKIKKIIKKYLHYKK